MPLYEYKCSFCGHADSEYQKIASSSDPITCPKCCVTQAYERQVSLPHTDLKAFHKPIEMYSVAMEDLGEIQDFKRRCPDVAVSENPDDPLYGVPIAASRKQKCKALEASGFVERN